MSEHTNQEPLWVGMDVDAELARYAEVDRVEQSDAPAAPGQARPRPRVGLRAALSSLGRGAVPPPRIAA